MAPRMATKLVACTPNNCRAAMIVAAVRNQRTSDAKKLPRVSSMFGRLTACLRTMLAMAPEMRRPTIRTMKAPSAFRP